MEELGYHRREGLGKKSNTRLGLVFFLSVSVLMFFFSLYGAQASVFQKARETLLDISSPVLSVLNRPILFVQNRLGAVDDYFNILEQNQQLREENAELREWMHEAITLRRQVSYFQETLSINPLEGQRAIDASVIGESGGPFQQSLIINMGRAEGVDVGYAVINTEGLIGRVVVAGEKASRVLMLTDFSSKIPVFVEGANIDAILAGRSNENAELEFFATRDLEEMQTGMRIITSGSGGTIPRGIPVGEVTVSDDNVKVNLFSRYSATDYVRVVQFEFVPNILEELSVQDGGE